MWSSSSTLFSDSQFYPHCFNVKITGNGNVVSKDVIFLDGYKRDDSGIKFRLYSDENAWDHYVSYIHHLPDIETNIRHKIISGPFVYRRKYENPVGPKPVVEPKDAGVFPPQFEAKVVAHKKKEDDWAKKAMKDFNKMDPEGKFLSALNAYSLEIYASMDQLLCHGFGIL